MDVLCIIRTNIDLFPLQKLSTDRKYAHYVMLQMTAERSNSLSDLLSTHCYKPAIKHSDTHLFGKEKFRIFFLFLLDYKNKVLKTYTEENQAVFFYKGRGSWSTGCVALKIIPTIIHTAEENLM